MTVDLDQTYTISIEYGCGCAEYWTVSQPPHPDDVVVRCPEACPPTDCPTCIAAGRLCAAREALVRFKPATFTEIVPVRRTIRRKASA